MGVIDDDNMMTPRGANDDVANDDDKDLSRQDGAPSLDDDGNDDADADDGLDDDNSIGGGGRPLGGGYARRRPRGGESSGGGGAPTVTERRRRSLAPAAPAAPAPALTWRPSRPTRGRFAQPANYTLDHRSSFRANLRKRLWSRLGELCVVTPLRKQREACAHVGCAATEIGVARAAVAVGDPEIHLKMDFEDGTYRRTEEGERMRRLGLSGSRGPQTRVRRASRTRPGDGASPPTPVQLPFPTHRRRDARPARRSAACATGRCACKSGWLVTTAISRNSLSGTCSGRDTGILRRNIHPASTTPAIAVVELEPAGGPREGIGERRVEVEALRDREVAAPPAGWRASRKWPAPPFLRAGPRRTTNRRFIVSNGVRRWPRRRARRSRRRRPRGSARCAPRPRAAARAAPRT